MATLIFLSLVCSSAFLTIYGASFNESCSASDSPCQALLAYRAPSTGVTIGNLSRLFFVNSESILSANGYPPQSNTSTLLANETIKIPVECPCVGNARAGNITYTVLPDEYLDLISQKYGRLVTFMEIANASRIADPKLILVGQKVTIPYPCSCRGNKFGSRDVVYMSYAVQEGETLQMFSQEYGVSQSDLLNLNPGGVSPANVTRIPILACKPSFHKDAIDNNLTVASGSYVTTANGCVQCSCTNGTQLICTRSPIAQSRCSLATCPTSPRLQIGKFNTKTSSTGGGCTVESCLYNGYNSTSIFTKVENQTTSVACPSVEAPPTFAYAPEGQGVPEAIGGNFVPLPAISPTSVVTPASPSGTNGTAPPPSAASHYSPIVALMLSLFVLVL